MSELSEFQRKCDSALQALVEGSHDVLETAELRQDPLENENPAIVRKIVGKYYELWIYSDEAQIQGPDIDLRFELPDYSSSEALCAKFLESVKGLLSI